jgi:hydrogenase expression/formation protein HypC
MFVRSHEAENWISGPGGRKRVSNVAGNPFRTQKLFWAFLPTMCLAVPGKIVSISDADPLLRAGKVSFGGVIKEVCLAYVPEAKLGDYVVVHVGFALSIVDEEEAHRVFDYLKQMEELGELEPEGGGQPPQPEVASPQVAKSH